MNDQKFSGILNEILKRYPNIDVADFLEIELGIPRFKADALANRIEEKYCKKAPLKTELKIQRLFEKLDNLELTPKDSVYSVECLSEKEFEHFMRWVFEELGYKLQPERCQTGFSFTVLAEKQKEKVAIQAIRCPKNYKISTLIIRATEGTMRKYGCAKSIVVATSSFTQQAIEEAQKANIELWNQAILTQKVAEAKKEADMQVQSRFPAYQGTLLQSLFRLKDGKDFLLEAKPERKYDLFLPGVKYPLLTFQAQGDTVTRCIFRIKYNEPVNESEGEDVMASGGDGDRLGYDDMKVYTSIIHYLEQFLE